MIGLRMAGRWAMTTGVAEHTDAVDVADRA